MPVCLVSDCVPVPRRARTALLALAALALCSGCSAADGQNPGTVTTGGTGGNGTGGAAAAGGGGSGASDKAVGYFNVELDSSAAYTSVIGFVYDGVPNTEATIATWEFMREQGGCQLLAWAPPFCDPACAPDKCVDDDVCRPDPTRRDVGTVTVYGLQTQDGLSEFGMDPIGGSYQPSGSVTLLYPPCGEGDEVRMASSGGDYAPFEVQSTGISPLELLGSDIVALQPDQPVTLQWTAAGANAASRIAVKIDISHHGGRKGIIACDVDDTGSLEISEYLVNGLLGLGYAGYPTVVVERKAVGSTSIEPGRVDLKVSSSLERSVAIPGLVSCNVDEDCGTGQTCQANHTCG
jgi:hypothetical protein